jgi:signal transduction histidine kinase
VSTTKSALPFDEARMLEGAGRQVMAEVNTFFSRERLERAATQDERLRLARELHDGALQSLSAVALQLQVLWRLIEINPETARERVRAVQGLIEESQRELRDWIEKLESSAPSSIASAKELAAALEKLRERAERQWALRVELGVDGRGTVPRLLGDEIYRLVQEGLTNIGRHSRASVARVSIKLGSGSDPVYIVVSDDGCGFPFRGRYDLAELARRGIGPRSLRERAASLRGELVLISELSGSRLEISLPKDQPSPRRPLRKFADV